MFYSQYILAKRGPLGTIWIAAHLDRRLRKQQITETDIAEAVRARPCQISPCQIISRSNRPADFARRARVDPRASPARARIESTAFERFSRRRVPASRATARVVPARALDAAEEGIESSPRMNSMNSPTRPSDPAIPPVDLSTSHPPHPIPSHQNLQNRS
jgi:hypothetical protein